MAEDVGELAIVRVTRFDVLERYLPIAVRVAIQERHEIALMRPGKGCERCRLTAIVTGPKVKAWSFNKSGVGWVGDQRLQRRAAAIRWAMVAACLLVSACRGDRAQDVDACWVEAIKGHPSQPVDAPDVLATIPQCMRARGYDSQMSSEFCPVSNQATTALNPDCYRPRGIVSRTLYTAEFLMRHFRR